MIPIYEQGKGQGIGYGFNNFLRRFVTICEEHQHDQRARAFAFILYDFENTAIRKVLKLQGGFARLDRLSGHDISIFYLHSGSRDISRTFNEIFMGSFGLSQTHQLPLVLFFNMRDGDVEGVEVYPLEQDNIAFAFDEVFGIIEDYVKKMRAPKMPPAKHYRAWVALKKIGKVAGEKTLEVLISKAVEGIGKPIW
ncbi:MAG: hypothetical protein JKY70_07665 [Mucilaginibacter sp.]|nr:hypothetical protein [Mucilaginibacter sp.]